MKQLSIFTVPKDSPSEKERLDAFKAKHQIETHNAGGNAAIDDKWIACHLPSAWELGVHYGVKKGDDLFKCLEKICRLLDDTGLVSFGRTERQAVEKACDEVGIQFYP